MSVPATIRHVISDTGGKREDGGAQLKANLEPDCVPLSPDVAMVDSDDKMDGHGNRDVKAEGIIAGQEVMKHGWNRIALEFRGHRSFIIAIARFKSST